MGTTLTAISLQGLVIAILPAAVVIGILFRWSAGGKTAIIATLRMLVQLLLIGYVLIYIFETDRPVSLIAVLTVMITIASLFAFLPRPNNQPQISLH